MHYKQFFMITALLLTGSSTIFCATPAQTPIVQDIVPEDEVTDPDLDYLNQLDEDQTKALAVLKEEPTLGHKIKIATVVVKEKIKATAQQATRSIKRNRGKWLISALGLTLTVAAAKVIFGKNRNNPPDPEPKKKS